ncbi:hypothetical protein KUCAC02_004431, partial [Chaenocephalus aceratus]
METAGGHIMGLSGFPFMVNWMKAAALRGVEMSQRAPACVWIQQASTGPARQGIIIIFEFKGIPESPRESWEESEYKVRELLRTELQMDEERIEVERAHQMGNSRGADKPRQIVVKFLRFKDKTAVMGRRNVLKGTNIFLNEDYPEAVRHERKELIPAMKAERSKGNIAYI